MRQTASKTMPSKPSKLPEKKQIWLPPKWGWDLVRAFVAIDVEATTTARCEEAGICRKTYYAALKDKQFVAWFRQALNEAFIAELSEVKRAHLKLIAKGDLDAIRLWYEKYGEFIPTQRFLTPDLSKADDSQLAELERFLAQIGENGEAPAVH
jgi:hypothetical protein